MPLQSALGYMDLSKSSYFYERHARQQRRQEYPLDAELEKLLLNLQGYELTLGYDKLTDYLRQKHEKIWNKKKVYRHMKVLQLLQRRRIKRRWKKNKRLPWSCAIKSNVRWEADLVFVYTAMGNVYLFVIEDTYDREVLSGHMDIQCGAQQAIECLKEALKKRFVYEEVKDLTVTLRIDRGCQFTAEAFAEFAESQGIGLEFCGIRTPNDKPYIESFISCYKCEEVYRNHYEDFFQAYDGWKNYIEWYNNLRPHGALNNMSPVAFRQSKVSTILA